MNYFLSTFLLFICHLNTSLAAAPITLCYEDVTVFPWITGDDEGLAIAQVRMVEKVVKKKFNLVRLPWKRCQLELKTGKIDGLIAASFTKERTSWGVYPIKKNGEPDPHFRMHTDSFVVYARKESGILWKNKSFVNLNGQKIGIQRGYSVESDLSRSGYDTNATFSTTLELLRALDNKLVTVAVLQKYSTDKNLSLYPELKKNIQAMDEPFKIADQYLLFSKSYYAKNSKTVQRIWETIPLIRESTDYARIQRNLLSQK